MTTTTELARLRAHRRALFERHTSRAEPFEHGIAFFTPAHPTKWDLNLLVVEDASEASAEALIAEAERLQAPAGLRHRKVEVHAGGDALVEGFTAAGWSAERVVVMLLRPGADQRGDAPAAVREVEFAAVRGLMEQWYGEAMSAAEAHDLGDADADTARTSGSRFFLTERDGEPAASCMLLPGDGIGQVEEVYTAKPHRGAGLASAVVRAAIAAAQERGDDLIMIMADADDWPQRLYERLGFETVDVYRSFTRKPPPNTHPPLPRPRSAPPRGRPRGPARRARNVTRPSARSPRLTLPLPTPPSTAPRSPPRPRANSGAPPPPRRAVHLRTSSSAHARGPIRARRRARHELEARRSRLLS